MMLRVSFPLMAKEMRGYLMFKRKIQITWTGKMDEDVKSTVTVSHLQV